MTIIGKFFKWVSKAFFNLDAFSKKCVPVVVDAVEGIKKAMDNPNSDLVLEVIKGTINNAAGNVIIDKAHAALHIWVPMVLLKLQRAEEILLVEDLNTKLQLALNELKFSSDENKTMFWKGISSLLLTKLTGGKVDIDQAYVVVQDYYNAYIKKP
jgi:hypothetical protein